MMKLSMKYAARSFHCSSLLQQEKRSAFERLSKFGKVDRKDLTLDVLLKKNDKTV